MALVLVLSAAGPADAAETTAWVGWTLAAPGSATADVAPLGIAAVPGITLTTDSAASIDPQPSGATAYLTASTPPGAALGSTQGRPYLNLRQADDAPPTPSTTTIAFSEPMPPGGWFLVAGDIDTDVVTISAVAPDGSAVAGAALGTRGTFNYCDVVAPRPPTCSGVAAPFDVPPVLVGASTVVLDGSGANTTGPAGWIAPTVDVSTLTVSIASEGLGSVVQLWLGLAGDALGGDVTCMVDGAEQPLPGVDVVIDRTASPAPLLTVTTDASGAFSAPAVLAGAGYRLSVVDPVTLPDGRVCAPAAAAVAMAVDTSAGPATDIRLGLDLAAEPPPEPPPPEPPPPDSPTTPAPASSATEPSSTSMLPPTGAGPVLPAIGAVIAILAGLALLAGTAGRRPARALR